MNDDPWHGALFGAVRRLVLAAAAVVLALWVVAVVLWLGLRLIDW